VVGPREGEAGAASGTLPARGNPRDFMRGAYGHALRHSRSHLVSHSAPIGVASRPRTARLSDPVA